MKVTATLKYLRIAPRKVRLVSEVIKGMDAMAAINQLNYWAKRSARPIIKLLNSAMSNAHNNYGLVKDNLFIKEIRVDEGSKLKRFRAKGFGRAAPIQKKTSHITIVLDEKVAGLKADKKVKEEKPEVKEIKVEKAEKPKLETEKRKEKPAATIGSRLSNTLKNTTRRFFRRKTG
ncbi:MAG: LSU ribosomal protein L22p (L17e) [Parcubacteria group bacterium Licking1014_17]|nr:MAG: LSU ribosomal protein L22p (L17e) [Parcubacteria group bacterium Licking1014_17]